MSRDEASSERGMLCDLHITLLTYGAQPFISHRAHASCLTYILPSSPLELTRSSHTGRMQAVRPTSLSSPVEHPLPVKRRGGELFIRGYPWLSVVIRGYPGPVLAPCRGAPRLLSVVAVVIRGSRKDLGHVLMGWLEAREPAQHIGRAVD